MGYRNFICGIPFSDGFILLLQYSLAESFEMQDFLAKKPVFDIIKMFTIFKDI